METKHTTSLLLYLFFLACLQSCGQAGNSSQINSAKIETYDQFRMQHLEYRDSLFIFYTAQRWNDSNFDVFEDLSKMFKTNNSVIRYFNGGAFYSPDKLKIIVWEGEQKPNAFTITKYTGDSSKDKICPGSKVIVYSMTAIVGFREDTNQIWHLYPLCNQMADCFDNRDAVINVLGQYYFEKMKDHTMWRLIQSGPQKGEEVSTPYGYNLQDKGFWEKCWLWEKDTITADGLYPFQKKGYNHIGYGADRKMRADPVLPPKIEYPDYILKLFR